MNNLDQSGFPSPNLPSVSLKPRAINDPEHVLVERFSGSSFFWFKVGMLNLYGKPG